MPLIEIDGLRIDLVDQGNGPPVVLLHSAGMGAAQWRALIARLSETHRLLAPNQRGYGRTAAPAAAPAAASAATTTDIALETELAGAVIRSAGEPVHLVGHSMGALLALRASGIMPDRIRSLTLVEPVIIGALRSGGETAALDEIGAMIGAFRAACEAGNVDQAMRSFTDYWYGKGAWDKIPKAQRLPIFARAASMHADVRAIWDDSTPLDAYRCIDCPALVLGGERTTPAARRMAELLAEALPRACFEVVPLAGHMAPVTHADLVAPMLLRHFDEAADAHLQIEGGRIEGS